MHILVRGQVRVLVNPTKPDQLRYCWNTLWPDPFVAKWLGYA